jgi:GNAT superfamily N-acetyltransferase
MNMDEKIVEMQEESEEGDEIIFTLFVNGQIVSWAKTLLYSNLEEIHTARMERRKGFGRKLLAHLEKNAEAHRAIMMKMEFDESFSDANGFFRSMGYRLKPVENYESRFVEATKKLQKNCF